jgi:large subunit ribosomal protein L7/L12
MADITKDQVVDYLSNLPVIQIAELIKTLEDKWGVKAAPAAVAVAATGAAPAAANADDMKKKLEEAGAKVALK